MVTSHRWFNSVRKRRGAYAVFEFVTFYGRCGYGAGWHDCGANGELVRNGISIRPVLCGQGDGSQPCSLAAW
jgi:hypothetical protein